MLQVYSFQPGYPLLKAQPPADRRGAQMKAPSERAPRGKYAGGVLELIIKGKEAARYGRVQTCGL